MNVLSASELSLSFGARTLFDNLSFTIADNDRLAIIGRNGSGKTSLMRILAGAQDIDGGNISVAQGARVGYLDQNLAESPNPDNLIDFVLNSVPARTTIEDRILEIENEIGDCQDPEKAMELAHELTESLELRDQLESDFAAHHAHAILSGLGFSQEEQNNPVNNLSGGWRMRAHLAALLFSRPHLLLLDEPTNHLDVPTVAWFSDFLKQYKNAFVLISHDRDFVNEQVSGVIAIEKERTRVYPGNYDAYVKAREEEEVILHARAKNVEKQKQDMQRFIDRFRAQANKAKAVQSRVKALEKMEDIVLPTPEDDIRIRIPSAEKPVSTVVRVSDLGHDYGRGLLFDDLNLVVSRGDKVCIIGENGAGKTTLLRIIAGELSPTQGNISIGNRVKPGYYAQHHTAMLDLERTIYEEVALANAEASQTAVRTVLGSLLFRESDVDKRISVLSGGERARVCMAKLIISPTNLLLMDEPTNHLDLESSEALAIAMREYDGTIVFVSHNMALVRKVSERVWNLTRGTFEDYPGSYTDYEYRLKELKTEAAAAAPPTVKATKSGSKKNDNTKPKKTIKQGQKKLRQEIDDLEKSIDVLESSVWELSQDLSDLELSPEDRRRIGEKLGQAQEELAKTTSRWEKKSLELEQIAQD